MKWLLIDLSCLAYAAKHTTGNLSHEDIPTGVMFGFFEQLYTICKTIKSNRIIICTDSKKSYRKRAFLAYKEKRKERRTPEEIEQVRIMYEQVAILANDVLPAMGVCVVRQAGLESDDLLAYIAKTLTKHKEEGVIVTTDGDLYQCITPYITWYDPSRDNFMDEESFLNKKGIAAKDWWKVKALAGCTSDNVPGLKGVGEKGAIKYLNGEMPEHHKQAKVIAESNTEIKKMKRLVKLPHHKTKPFTFYEPKWNAEPFFEFCERYNISSYIDKKKKQWTNFFKGKLSVGTKLRKKKKRKRRSLV